MAKRNKGRKARRAKKKEASMLVPPERDKYGWGGIGKGLASGAKSLLKKVPKKQRDEIATSSTNKELAEFDTSIRKDNEKNVLSPVVDDIVEKREKIEDYTLSARDLKRLELSAIENEKILKEEFGYTEKQLEEIKKRSNSIVDYVGDLEWMIEEEGGIYQEFDPGWGRGQMAEGFEDTPTGQWEGETINDPISVLRTKSYRGKRQAGGSMLVPPEMGNAEVPVDTYPNIPPEEMAAVEASQLPDEQMEDNYVDFVMNEALDQEEQMYLMNTLENDPQLSIIFDKVVTVASEFSGSGEVTGPGTGVSDSIPARLSDGEFVMTKKATDQIGADNLQRMMDDAERAYDGGLMRGKDEEEELAGNMNKVMRSANQMPSLNVRQR